MAIAEPTETTATAVGAPQTNRTSDARNGPRVIEPPFHFSDLWQAPLHDLPLRNEVLFENFKVSPAMRVLEVGPGSGFTTFLLSRIVREVVALDVSRVLVDDLGAELASASNVRLVCADICNLSTGVSLEEKFDLAFCLDVLEYLLEPGEFFSNVFRMLKPGGQLLVSFPNVPPPQGDGVTWFRSRKELEELICNAGFSKFELYKLTLNRYVAVLYQISHELPSRYFRWLRARNRNFCPQVYDQTWTFKHRDRMRPLKFGLHCYWQVISFAMGLRRPVFKKEPLGENILRNQILILARR